MPDSADTANRVSTEYHPILPLLLRILAVVLFVYWGLTHLIYPEWYLVNLMGITQYHPGEPYDVFATNLIGVLNIALAITVWRAAADPARYRIVIDMIFIASVGTVAVFVFSLLRRGLSPREWLNTGMIVAVIIVLAFLYPRGKASSERIA